jgi:hypothetical protein
MPFRQIEAVEIDSGWRRVQVQRQKRNTGVLRCAQDDNCSISDAVCLPNDAVCVYQSWVVTLLSRLDL